MAIDWSLKTKKKVLKDKTPKCENFQHSKLTFDLSKAILDSVFN